MGYSPPVVYEAGGKRQLIVWDPQYINSLDPKTGKLHWQQAFNVKGGMSVTTPVLSEGNLLVSQFYGGSMMLELSDTEAAAKLKWKGNSNSEMPDQTDGLHSLITTPIIEGDTIYARGGEMGTSAAWRGTTPIHHGPARRGTRSASSGSEFCRRTTATCRRPE